MDLPKLKLKSIMTESNLFHRALLLSGGFRPMEAGCEIEEMKIMKGNHNASKKIFQIVIDK